MHRLLIKLQVPFCLHVIRTRQSQAQHTDLTKKLKERAEGLPCSKSCPNFSVGVDQAKVLY